MALALNGHLIILFTLEREWVKRIELLLAKLVPCLPLECLAKMLTYLLYQGKKTKTQAERGEEIG